MDIDLTDDQRMLQDTTRRFLEDRSPVTALRKIADNKLGLDRAIWRECAEQGWVALFVPEAFGGFSESAQGVLDAAIIAEETGRVVFSGPLLPTCVAAFAIAQAGSDAQREALLPGLAAGETVAAWCLSGPGVRAGIEPGGVIATRDGDGFVLNGTAGFVQDAADADLLLVTAVDGANNNGAGVSQFVIPAGTAGITLAPRNALDLGRRLADVRFDGVRLGADALLGTAGEAAAMVERQLQLALVLQSAETVGVTDRALEFTLDYMKQRMAFGRPIGSFQALKHRVADHATQLEGAKAAVAHAARAVHEGAADAAIAVSVAKSQSGRWGTEIIRDCLQLHGGIGMTWEHDIHFYLRRAVSNEALWGAPPVHHERLCRLAGL
ncbi:acyl-CoA dehydrogenase family protein [Novosphingobium bradum]|uniref:Acyl-CoA dehydrogenase family protein n=1 Tax=Novosphingobium bradum TaxID=1737444 RepID=A0ABV7ILH4_9SPHN